MTPAPALVGEQTVTLISPLPHEWIALLWEWLQEVPTANFDDYSPTTFTDFEAEMTARLTREQSWGILRNGVPVGVVGYLPLTPRLGVFHGLCFTRAVWGTGVARHAVDEILAGLFASGVEKVCAYFFADNRRVARFFEKLGAITEGYQVDQTIREGRPITLQLVALFAPPGFRPRKDQSCR